MPIPVLPGSGANDNFYNVTSNNGYAVREATGWVVCVVNAASEVSFGGGADGLYRVYLTGGNSKELLHTEKITQGSR